MMSIKVEVSTLTELFGLVGLSEPDLPDFVSNAFYDAYDGVNVTVDEISAIAHEMDEVSFDNSDDMTDLAIAKGLATEETFNDVDPVEWIVEHEDELLDLYSADYDTVYGFTNDHAYIYYR